MMKLKTVVWTIAWTGALLITIPSAHAYVTCKPCGAPPLEVALDQAELIVLGRIGSVRIESQGKGQGGEAHLKVRVLQVLKKPSKRLTELPVRLAWDGACIPAPPPFEKGQQWVFFLSRAPQPQGASPVALWEGTPGHCSLKYVDPKSPEGNLKSLKASLRAR